MIEYRSAGYYWDLITYERLKINMIYEEDRLEKIVAVKCADVECLESIHTWEYIYEYKDNDIINVDLYVNGTYLDKEFLFEDGRLVKMDFSSLPDQKPNSYDTMFFNEKGKFQKLEKRVNGILDFIDSIEFRDDNLIIRNMYDDGWNLLVKWVIEYDDNPNPLKGCLPLYDIYGAYPFLTEENNIVHDEFYRYNQEDESLVFIAGENYIHEYNEFGYPVYTYVYDWHERNTEMFYEYECY
jgi:hypothetical protein